MTTAYSTQSFFRALGRFAILSGTELAPELQRAAKDFGAALLALGSFGGAVLAVWVAYALLVGTPLKNIPTGIWWATGIGLAMLTISLALVPRKNRADAGRLACVALLTPTAMAYGVWLDDAVPAHASHVLKGYFWPENASFWHHIGLLPAQLLVIVGAVIILGGAVWGGMAAMRVLCHMGREAASK